MSLKERIRNEMVIDKETLSLVKEMYKSLPTELQTIENFSLIERWAKMRILPSEV